MSIVLLISSKTEGCNDYSVPCEIVMLGEKIEETGSPVNKIYLGDEYEITSVMEGFRLLEFEYKYGILEIKDNFESINIYARKKETV